MEFPGLRLFLFLLLIGVDLGVAVYYRYMNVTTQVGYAAHIGGAVVGLLLGIVVLRFDLAREPSGGSKHSKYVVTKQGCLPLLARDRCYDF
jgi:hypothetical protein